MIKIITPETHSENRDLLRSLFSVRYDIFVKRRGWTELSRDDCLDIDDYDDADTSYVVKIVDDRIVAGARLRRTTQKHMLADVFSFLSFDLKTPVGEKIGECSRTFVDRRHPAKRSVFLELLIGVADWSIAHGIEELTGVLELWWVNSYLAVGLQPVPLGTPKDYNGMLLLGVKFKVDGEVRAKLAHQLGEMRKRGLDNEHESAGTARAARRRQAG